MFAWFQRLLPKTGGFFELFEAHAVALTGAGRRHGAPVQGGPDMHENAREIFEREHDADEIIREVLKTVRANLPHPVRPKCDHRSDRLDGRCHRRDAGRGIGDRAL